jgi:hypothetical protein
MEVREANKALQRAQAERHEEVTGLLAALLSAVRDTNVLLATLIDENDDEPELPENGAGDAE